MRPAFPRRRTAAAPIAALLALLLAPGRLPADGALRLPAIFGDHMVLQAERGARVWGWDTPGMIVRVGIEPDFAQQLVDLVQNALWRRPTLPVSPAIPLRRIEFARAKAVCDGSGRWAVTLDAPGAGGPYLLTVDGSGERRLHDVLVGEVWLASGQSNMEFSLGETVGAGEALAACEDPGLRLFQAGHAGSQQPQDDLAGSWRRCDPESARPFSAAAYFFGRQLRRTLGSAVGLVEASWGGTAIENWIPRPAMQQVFGDQIVDWQQKHRFQWVPEPFGTIFNGEIAPLSPFPLRGVLWYQGEANVAAPERYAGLLWLLVNSWRFVWAQDDLPFIAVQLPNYADPASPPGEARWARLRWAQQQAMNSLSRTALVVAVDLGDSHNIHPPSKKPLGRRLADAALALAYGWDLDTSGPRALRPSRSGARLLLPMAHAVGLHLAVRDPASFEVAGADGVVRRAQALVQGSRLSLWSPLVPKPVMARYDWSDDPPAELFNGEGLPAAPFFVRLGPAPKPGF